MQISHMHATCTHCRATGFHLSGCPGVTHWEEGRRVLRGLGLGLVVSLPLWLVAFALYDLACRVIRGW
jgi:hypothetical protein